MEFIHPYFLLGLPLAALPVIIHLWFRRRLKRIEFPSLKFLYTMERREFNWLRLREILILILRTITIIALFLALARPTVKTGLFGFNRTASLFLIIDDSYSMAYKDLFAKAKEIGCDLIDHYTQASQFLIVPLSQTDDFEFLTKERAQEKIQRLMVSQRKGDLGEVLERLRTVKTRYPKDFVFLTDLQAKNFTRITQPLTFKVKIIPISDDGDNTSITDIRLKDPVTIGLPVLLVKIKNYGVKPWSGKAILNSGLEQNVVLNPEEEKMVEFVFGQNQPTISGWVEVKEDFLSIDNIRYFFFKKMTKKKILIIMPDGYSDNIIKSALSPPGVQSPFAVEVIPQSALSQVDFNRFDGLIISNLTELNLFSLKKIEDFMNHKPVLILLGDRVNPSYEKFLSQYCTFQGLIVLDGFTTISYFDSHHPIFKIFGQKDFTGVKFYRITNIEPVRSKILSRFESGNVFLLEAQNLGLATMKPGSTCVQARAAV
ncbi:MAG: BatA domain-containing protein, partial [candidate division WOR-3 bacterium]